MRRTGIRKLILLACLAIAGSLRSFAQVNHEAVMGLISRILPGDTVHFEVGYIPRANDRDLFELSERDGRVLLQGNNGVAVASAFRYYLEHYCGCDIGWNGVNLHIPHPFPRVSGLIRRSSPYTYRYYLNYCTFNYTMSWWNWDRWQWEIDWMAMHGINMPLALTGEESIWYRVYRQLGFSAAQLRGFFSGPAYFSWFWMGNLDGWGGPLPRSWMDSHEALQKRILARERSFGMTPVLPAFSGHVPASLIQKYPDARLRKTNWGAGFPDVYLLDPQDTLFAFLGRKFLEAEKKTYGTDHFYSSDTFNENTPPSSDSSYLDSVSRAVYRSMAEVDPKAVWVMQGWLFVNNNRFWKPRQIQGLLNGVPNNHMIILDLWSESHPGWKNTRAYYGKPWIWCMLQNFGGNISLFGRMPQVASGPSGALYDPGRGKLEGIGLTPEGTLQNPALFELMTDNTWRESPIPLDHWLEDYARRRYGKANALADSAWMILKRTVYSGGLSEGGPESIISGRPTLDSSTVWTHTTLFYDPLQLDRAWSLMMRAAPALGSSDGFRYDLVDITRQVLANYATPLQQQFVRAFRDHDSVAFRKYGARFLQLMDDMDTLLGTRRDFLLGRWLQDARSWGTTPAERDLYEWNARNLITLWGGPQSPLHEYACKQWSGLIRGFYKPRWQQFFSYLTRCLRNGTPADIPAFDLGIGTWEERWTHAHQVYTASPRGDPVEVSRALYQKYQPLVLRAYKEK